MNLWIIKWINILIIFNNCIFTNGQQIQDLGGTWNVQNTGKEYDLSATVPGGIYSDLMKNDVIGDVFYGFNDTETRWVSKMDWKYSRTFKVEAEFLENDNINIVFDGVDTFSKILINGVEIGATDNMFVRYIFDVKPQLKLGDNQIEVHFTSAVNKAKDLFEEQAKNYKVVPLCLPAEYNGECHANHVRKMQASFSWDWGPALPSVGIWKKVYLEAYQSTVLRDVTVHITKNAEVWKIQLNVYLAKNSKTIRGTLVAKIIGVKEDLDPRAISVTENVHGDFLYLLEFDVLESDVELWWPNGYGDAKLYTLELQYTSLNNLENDKKTFKIGFRTIELVQDDIKRGTTFYFKVNGLPIFAKGSNSIPMNILPELGQNKDTIRFLLQSAKDVHMNMLRVWGGGTYEADIFYELADEMGIMIWQDFMFACAMYPTNDEFLRNVRSEVKHQVRRLQYHPSIVLWAGNNENEAALRQNWYGTAINFTVYHQDYKKLYVDTIKKELELSDNTRPYLTSSPTNGLKSEKEDYVAQNPQSVFYGDVHFYNYVQDSWIGNVYPINRFSSEYGYQSLPSINTLLEATNDTTNLMIDSSFLSHRQHLPEGYDKMKLLISYRLTLPSTTSEDYHRAYIYFSQIIQAMALKIQTEFYRQWRSYINKLGKGYTMGALYWQLNDVWVAPTWSGIDFEQNWKMMHYYARHFFAPVIVTGDLTSMGSLDIYIVSDLTKTLYDATLTISVYRWDSFIAVHNETFNVNVFSSISFKQKNFVVEEYFSKIANKPCGEYPIKNCFIYFTLTDSEMKPIAPDNFNFPIWLNSANIQKPVLQISNVKATNVANKYAIDIETTHISLFVWLEANKIPGRFSDNGFLQVTPKKTVDFYTEKSVTLDELKKSLSVTNLMEFESTSSQGRLAVHYTFWFIISLFLISAYN